MQDAISTDDDMLSLSACPLCGHEASTVLDFSRIRDGKRIGEVQVGCGRCKAFGQPGHDIKEASQRWEEFVSHINEWKKTPEGREMTLLRM